MNEINVNYGAYDIQHVAMEDKIPDSILNHVKKKNKTLTNFVKSQCPRQLKNVASLELVEMVRKSDHCLQHQQLLSQPSSTGECVHLSYTSLFKGDHSARKLSKRILIMGEAGTGKSVLVLKSLRNGQMECYFRNFRCFSYYLWIRGV